MTPGMRYTHTYLQLNYRTDMLCSGSNRDRVRLSSAASTANLPKDPAGGIEVLFPVQPDPGLHIIVEGTCMR